MFARGRYTNKAHTRTLWRLNGRSEAHLTHGRQADRQSGGSCHSVAPRGMLHICRHLQLSNDTAKEIAKSKREMARKLGCGHL